MSGPTLSGIERGRPCPVVEVEGGIWIEDADGNLTNKPAALKIISERLRALCIDYARQLLQARGDKTFLPSQIERWAAFFMMHHALVGVPIPGAEGMVKKLYPPPAELADKDGKLNISVALSLPLGDLADGQLDMLARVYDLHVMTQTPRMLTSQQWDAIVNEGKDESLKTLHSRHGSSALIQVLHGLRSPWPE